MSERLRDASNKKSDVLKAGLVAASLLGAHDKPEAADIPPDASWEQGVTELRRSVQHEKVEYGATFLSYNDGSHVWLPIVKGGAETVDLNLNEIAQSIAKDGKGVQQLCEIHTHPTVQKVLGVPGPRSPYSPPSTMDIFVISGGKREITWLAQKYSIVIQARVGAVFDGRGVWYYRVLSDEELAGEKSPDQNLALEEIKRQRENLSRESASANFNFDDAYKNLQQTYKQLHIKVRFVPFEQLEIEPPCAGPDYEPAKK